MLLLNIGTVLMLAAGCYAAGALTLAAWQWQRRRKSKRGLRYGKPT